jgi:hypothetical protein
MTLRLPEQLLSERYDALFFCAQVLWKLAWFEQGRSEKHFGGLRQVESRGQLLQQPLVG